MPRKSLAILSLALIFISIGSLALSAFCLKFRAFANPYYFLPWLWISGLLSLAAGVFGFLCFSPRWPISAKIHLFESIHSSHYVTLTEYHKIGLFAVLCLLTVAAYMSSVACYNIFRAVNSVSFMRTAQQRQIAVTADDIVVYVPATLSCILCLTSALLVCVTSDTLQLRGEALSPSSDNNHNKKHVSFRREAHCGRKASENLTKLSGRVGLRFGSQLPLACKNATWQQRESAFARERDLAF